ncbi:VCBS repeat-containing protein, partial [Ramlibacter sp.]|uniref:FG-GAP repeat domain-containing protein n=1 Tax=Ramlibacter sp. TaxID=1917967 RepID=UPI002C77C150
MNHRIWRGALGGAVLAAALAGCTPDDDVYDASSNQLTIPAVQIAGTAVVYTNVVVDIGRARIVSSGAPAGTRRVNSYNPRTNRLSVPAALVGQQLYSNVLLQLGADFRVLSVGAALGAPGSPLPVQPSSYEQKIAAAAALGPQPMPAEVQSGNAVAFADFFQDGSWSMVTHSLEYDARDAATAGRLGRIRFYRRGDGGWVDQTSTLLAQDTGCLHPRKAVVADFNGDARPDVFFACHGFDAPPFPGEQPVLLLSQPDGSYATSRLPFTGFFHGASAADVNGDGFPDLLVAENMVSHTPHFLINDGAGHFTQDLTRLPAALTYKPIFSAELVDAFGTGRYDAFLAGHESDGADALATLFANDGAGRYVGTRTLVFPRLDGYGYVTDAVFADGAAYLARTTDSQASFYTGAAIQKVTLATLASQALFTHSGPFARSGNWAWGT